MTLKLEVARVVLIERMRSEARVRPGGAVAVVATARRRRVRTIVAVRTVLGIRRRRDQRAGADDGGRDQRVVEMAHHLLLLAGCSAGSPTVGRRTHGATPFVSTTNGGPIVSAIILAKF